jgi:hypothetical protein
MAKQNSLSIQQKIGLRIKELRNKANINQENPFQSYIRRILCQMNS